VRAEVSAPGLNWLPADQTVFFAHRWDDFAPVLERIGGQSIELDNSSTTPPGGGPVSAEE